MSFNEINESRRKMAPKPTIEVVLGSKPLPRTDCDESDLDTSKSAPSVALNTIIESEARETIHVSHLPSPIIPIDEDISVDFSALNLEDYAHSMYQFRSDHTPRRSNITKKTKKKWRRKVQRLKSQAGDAQIPIESSGPVKIALDAFAAFKEYLSDKGIIGEMIVNRLEDACLHLYLLTGVSTDEHACALLCMYAKTFMSESLTTTATKFFTETLPLSTGLTEQAGPETPDWLTTLRQSHRNWKSFTTNPLFRKFSILLSAAVTLGICDASTLQWNVAGLRVFDASIAPRFLNTYELLDAVLETVTFFVEGGWACFKNQSLAPLMYSNHKGLELETEYGLLCESVVHVRTGNLEKITGMSVHELDLRLAKLALVYDELYLTVIDQWEKRVIENRKRELIKLRSDFDTIRVQGGIRVQPYGVTVFGASSVGKSTVTGIALITILKSNNLPSSDTDVVTINESDKFMSNYQSSVTGVIIDDIGNTKSDFVERAPTQRIIEMNNNIRSYANMAEIQLKGKVAIEPMVVVGTTNVKGLGAEVYSKEPFSICRRFQTVLTVHVKPQFRKSGFAGISHTLDQEKVEEFYTVDGIPEVPLIPDLWEITAERVVPIKSNDGRPDSVGYEIIKHNGKMLDHVSIFHVLDFLVHDSKKHYGLQARLVARTNNFSEKVHMCECHNMPVEVCRYINPGVDASNDAEAREPSPCSTGETEICDEFEPHAGLVDLITKPLVANSLILPFAKQLIKFNLVDLWQTWTSPEVIVDKTCVLFKHLETGACMEIARWLENSNYTWWTSYLPREYLAFPLVQRIAHWAYQDQMSMHVTRMLRVCALGVCLGVYRTWRGAYIVGPLIIGANLVVASSRVEIAKVALQDEIEKRSDAMPQVVKDFRESYVPWALKTGGVLAGLVAAIKLYRSFRARSCTFQSALDPDGEDDIHARDATTNPWLGVRAAPLPASDRARTMTHEDSVRLVGVQTLYMSIGTDAGNKACDAFFIGSNVAIIPKHIWDLAGTDEMLATFTKYDPTVVGASFKSILSRCASIDVPDTDLCYVWVSGGGSWKDLSHLLPLDTIRSAPAKMLYRDKSGELLTFTLFANAGQVGTRVLRYPGASYLLKDGKTFVGLCMAPVIAEAKQSIILGFHLAGHAGTELGACGTLLYSQHVAAISQLEKRRMVVLAPHAGTISTANFGVPWFLSSSIHRKSPVYYLKGQPCVEVYGTVIGRTSPRTSVQTSPISESVAKIFGVPQLWGPPKFYPEWRPYQENLAVSSQPSAGVEGNLLQEAIAQYVSPLLKIARTKYWQQTVRPLSRLEAVCGIPQTKFVDRMNMQSSMGHPIFKPKNRFLIELDPALHDGYSKPVDFTPEVWSEVDRCLAAYSRNERAYPVYNACLKDEPTKLTKDKVRVFHAAPTALQLLVRMYYLPIARMCSMNPLMSKMAIGINAGSPEWEEMFTHISKYGDTRVLAGDYANFDQRMSAQSILAAFSVFDELAKEFQYSDADRNVMRCLSADIAYPLVNFNGTLIQFFGMHCSGENMTVYINCLQSILNLYCFVIQMYPGVKVDDVIAFTTYGDDNIGTVAKGYPKVNIRDFSSWLACRDQIFTMPDKTSELVDYMSIDQVDFLKRKNVYIPEIECNVGALDENSIFKSLHCIRANSDLTPKELSIQNIDGALREWFFHGRAVFEMRQQQMLELLNQMCYPSREAHLTFDDRVQMWKENYRDISPETEITTH